MSSPLFNMLGGNNMPQIPGPLGNISNLIGQLTQFRNMFQGDPQQQVQQLLNTGQMSQSQFNQLSQMASQVQRMLNGR